VQAHRHIRRARPWFLLPLAVPLALSVGAIQGAANERVTATRGPALASAPAGANATLMKGRLTKAARLACHELRMQGTFCRPLDEEHRALGPGLGYSTLRVKVGPGEYDVITLHRVASEERGRPVAGRRAVFLIHGDIWGFEPAFLGLTAYADPPQASLPTFLTKAGVDVWGISNRWAHAPADPADASFMAHWGMSTAVSDARVGLRIARVARRADGLGDRRIHVLGWSRGVWATLALANAEATERPRRRDIAGLIPVEGAFKVDPANEAFRLSTCADYEYYQGLLDAGTFGADETFFQAVGQQALDSPDDPSPFAPELTNRQFAMGVVSWPVGIPGLEWYHFSAGSFDDDGVPQGLVYTDPSLSAVELARVYAFDPVRYLLDASAITCNELDVPWDDRLDRVHLPILYVGAGGGFGPLGEYQTRLVDSADVTVLIVRTQREDLAAFDVGHADVFQAPLSRELFWAPIRDWILSH
jgi:hypothetical protein